MQRYSLNLKGGTYNEQRSYNLTPIYRQQVVPGQTTSIDAMVNIKSSSLTKLVTTPSLCSVWFFYVPHRLVWDQWTDFISKSEPGVSMVTTTTQDPYVFDKAVTGSQMNPFYRRACKLVYNEYFAQRKGTEYDVDADGTLFNNPNLMNPDSFIKHLRDDSEVEDTEFTVTANSIPLNEFYRDLMNARSKQRSQMTGHKYVDTLARMGVDASWMVTDRPEFLGTKSKLVGPQLHASTESATLGQEVSRYNCSLSLQIGNKHFAEHGYIVGMAAFRPLVMFDDRGATDMFFITKDSSSYDWLDGFYSADNTQTRDFVPHGANGFTNPGEGSWNAERFAYLKHGSWVSGSGNTWVPNYTAADWEGLVNPVASSFNFFGTDLGATHQVAFTSSVNLKGRTPVPKRVA